MPKLVEQSLIDALTTEVGKSEHDGLSVSEIVSVLNTPEVIGHETASIDAAAAYTAISPATLQTLDAAAGSDAAAAGEALWLISALADVEPLSLAEGSTARSTLDALTEAGLIPQAEHDALVVAAQIDVLGQTIGQKLGIGNIYPQFIEQVNS